MTSQGHPSRRPMKFGMALVGWCIAGNASAEKISLDYSWSSLACKGLASDLSESSCEGVGGASQVETVELKESPDASKTLVGEWSQDKGDLQATIRIYRYLDEAGNYGRYSVSTYVTNEKGESSEAELGFDNLKLNPSLSLKSIPVETADGYNYSYFNVYLKSADENLTRGPH